MGQRTRIGLVTVAVYCGWGLGVATALQTTVGGRSLELTGKLEIRQVIRADQDTPNELNLQQLWLGVKYDLNDVARFQSVISVLNGGPTTKSTGGGIYDFSDVFQSLSPAVNVEEAYLDVNQQEFNLRLGFQKFAWGKLDRIQPTDVLNTRKYRDPFLPSEEELKRGVPAAQLNYYIPEGEWVPQEARLTFIWIPHYFPFEFGLPGERWFPPAAVPPSSITISPVPLPCVGTGCVIDPAIPISFRVHNVAPQPFQLNNSGYAFRASGFSAGVDYAFYYYHGLDMQPAFDLTATATAHRTPGSEVINVTADTVLSPVFKSIDMWGADGAYSVGGFTFRGEGAFISGRPFPRNIRTLVATPQELIAMNVGLLPQLCAGGGNLPVNLPSTFEVRDAFEWGLGADYDLEGYFLLFQVNQTDIFNNDVRLLVPDIDTRVLANIRKTFWHDDVQLQLIAIYAFESSYSVLLPRITYRIWEGLEAQVGYLNITGSVNSIIGQYKRNDEGFLLLRYLF